MDTQIYPMVWLITIVVLYNGILHCRSTMQGSFVVMSVSVVIDGRTPTMGIMTWQKGACNITMVWNFRNTCLQCNSTNIKYFLDWCLLYVNQSGFRAFHCCETALTRLVDMWTCRYLRKVFDLFTINVRYT